MLSRYERRRLREIENRFAEDDPKFAQYVRAGPVKSPPDSQLRFLRALMATGVVIVLIGIFAASPVLVFLGICCSLGALSASSWLRWKTGRDDDETDS